MITLQLRHGYAIDRVLHKLRFPPISLHLVVDVILHPVAHSLVDEISPYGTVQKQKDNLKTQKSWFQPSNVQFRYLPSTCQVERSPVSNTAVEN